MLNVLLATKFISAEIITSKSLESFNILFKIIHLIPSSSKFGVSLVGCVRGHFMNLLQVPNDIEAMSKCARAIGATEMTDASAFMTHVAGKRMLYLVPE